MPPPTNYAVLLFPGFQALDAFGPLDVLNVLSHSNPLNTLSIISRSYPSPASTQTHIVSPTSTFHQCIVPTHSLSDPPSNIEVLIVPGGHGTRSEDLESEIGFIKDVFPHLKYLITVCTGSALAARAGVLDGLRATTNKKAWGYVTGLSNKVEWVAKARWVEDGKVFTAAGVSAGIDATLAYVAKAHGQEEAEKISEIIEYDWHKDSSWDPFAELSGLV